jgi:ParB family chromosome partitioning protein
MSRKRKIFDIEMPPVDEIPVGKMPDRVLEKRRGPMAAAISENADALRGRQSVEDAIRAENDALAHELVRLRNEGLVTELVPLDQIFAEKLTRDRAAGPDPELEELKTSIREVGLSNPVRLERRDGQGYELIQGMRRLTAYRALLEETGDPAYAAIPAAISSPAAADDSYRRMVDENLIRKDISFAEMGKLATAYADDPANGCPDVDKAVAVLFKSASYTKRSYIRAFASLLMNMGKVLEHPNAIPRNVGVELKRKMDADPGLISRISTALAADPDRGAAGEVAILRSFLNSGAGEPAAPKAGKPAGAPRKAKTTFQISRPDGIAKCSASNGRIDLQFDLDFTRLDRRKLEAAVAQLIDTLQKN